MALTLMFKEHDQGVFGVRATLVLSTALVLLMVLAGVPSAAAQSSATVAAEDVSVSGDGETATTEISITATDGVTVADTKVSVDTDVATVSDATSRYDRNPLVDIKIAPDGSYVWLNYTDIRGSQTEFTVGTVEFTANADGDASIGLETNNYYIEQDNRFDTVNQDGAQLSVEGTGAEPADSGGQNSTGTDEDGTGEDDDTAGDGDVDSTDGTTDGDTSTDDTDQTNTDGGTSDGSTDDGSTDGGTDGASDGTDSATDTSQSTGEDLRAQTNQSEGEDSQTNNGSSDDTGDGQGLPGFTAVAALVALLSVALRRAER